MCSPSLSLCHTLASQPTPPLPVWKPACAGKWWETGVPSLGKACKLKTGHHLSQDPLQLGGVSGGSPILLLAHQKHREVPFASVKLKGEAENWQAPCHERALRNRERILCCQEAGCRIGLIQLQLRLREQCAPQFLSLSRRVCSLNPKLRAVCH